MSATGAAATTRPGHTRTLRIWHFLALVVIYVIIVQGTSLVLTAGSPDTGGSVTTISQLLRHIIIPVGAGAAFTLAVVAFLGRWDEVFVDRRPFRRWTLIFPLALAGVGLVITNYGGLAAKGLEFTLLFLFGTLMVGFTEELMFRGIGVLTFRDSGRSDIQVAIWVSLIFGAAHASNIVVAGPSALLQALLTTATGLLFYVIFRSTGALVVAMAAHGLWDFSVLSSQIDPDTPWPLVNLSAVVLGVLVLLIVLLRRRLMDQPADAAQPTRA